MADEKLQLEGWDVNFGKLLRKLYSNALRLFVVHLPVDAVRMLHLQMGNRVCLETFYFNLSRTLRSMVADTSAKFILRCCPFDSFFFRLNPNGIKTASDASDAEH